MKHKTTNAIVKDLSEIMPGQFGIVDNANESNSYRLVSRNDCYCKRSEKKCHHCQAKDQKWMAVFINK